MKQLNKNYSLTNDSNNWILKFESDVKINKKGKEYTSKDEWYFSEPHQALERFLSESTKDTKTAEDFLEEIYKVKHIIAGLNI